MDEGYVCPNIACPDIATPAEIDVAPEVRTPPFTWLAPQRVSRLNKINLKHEVTVILRSDEPFFIDRGIDITAHQLNSTQFALALTQCSLEFGKFPPEIKNIIYSYVFEDLASELQITLASNDKPRAQIKTGVQKGKAGSLLLVNKEISQEARSWLYGSKTFSFHYQYVCQRFLEAIGPENRSFVRKVELQTWGVQNKGSFEKVLQMLKESSKFETLILSDYTIRATYNAIRGNPKNKAKTWTSATQDNLADFVSHFAEKRGSEGVKQLLSLTWRHEEWTPQSFFQKPNLPPITVEQLAELKQAIYNQADELVENKKVPTETKLSKK